MYDITRRASGGGDAQRCCEPERGSITAGERAWLCNDDAYQCPGCKTPLLIVSLCNGSVHSHLQLQGLHSRVFKRSNICHREPLLPHRSNTATLQQPKNSFLKTSWKFVRRQLEPNEHFTNLLCYGDIFQRTKPLVLSLLEFLGEGSMLDG